MTESKGKVKRLALCKSRHSIPGVIEAIYPSAVDFTDLDAIDSQADRYACQCKLDGLDIDLYVTGVQYPLVAVINACLKRKVKLTLYHFNPNGEEYYSQELYQEGLDE